jgi:hypothetical protein
MIKLNYKSLNSGQFNQAVFNLMSQNGFASNDVSKNLAGMFRQFQSALMKARNSYNEMSKEFMDTSEDGKTQTVKPDMKDVFDKKMEEFMATEVTFLAEPIKESDLGQVRLSPAQLLELEPILDPSFFGSREATSAQ